MAKPYHKSAIVSDSFLRHPVFVSKLNRQLLLSLANFFAEGIHQGDLCFAVLRSRHSRLLRKLLKAQNINVDHVRNSGQLLIFTPRSLRVTLDPEEDFNEELYHKKLEEIARLAAQKGQSARGFGEIVPLSWPRFRSRWGLYVPQNE